MGEYFLRCSKVLCYIFLRVLPYREKRGLVCDYSREVFEALSTESDRKTELATLLNGFLR